MLWERDDALFLVDRAGTVRRSRDGGASFEVVGGLDAEPVAPLAAHDGALYAAVEDGRVLSSRDRGRTWRTLVRVPGLGGAR